MAKFKKGDRVTRWGSLRVGTVEYVNSGIGGDWVGVKWDYPRLPAKYGMRVEDNESTHEKHLEPATEYAEFWNRATLRERAKAPRPHHCMHCGSEDLRFIERQSDPINEIISMHVYVWKCLNPACQRMTRYIPEE